MSWVKPSKKIQIWLFLEFQEIQENLIRLLVVHTPPNVRISAPSFFRIFEKIHFDQILVEQRKI
jgi:hypothetical protein